MTNGKRSSRQRVPMEPVGTEKNRTWPPRFWPEWIGVGLLIGDKRKWHPIVKIKNQRIRIRFVSPDALHIAPTKFVYQEGAAPFDCKL